MKKKRKQTPNLNGVEWILKPKAPICHQSHCISTQTLNHTAAMLEIALHTSCEPVPKVWWSGVLDFTQAGSSFTKKSVNPGDHLNPKLKKEKEKPVHIKAAHEMLVVWQEPQETQNTAAEPGRDRLRRCPEPPAHCPGWHTASTPPQPASQTAWFICWILLLLSSLLTSRPVALHTEHSTHYCME